MKKGFTLVELSIVLIIIGMLIFAAVESLSIIESAKFRKEAAKIKDINNKIILYLSAVEVVRFDTGIGTDSFINTLDFKKTLNLEDSYFKSLFDNYYYSPAFIRDNYVDKNLNGYKGGFIIITENRLAIDSVPGVVTVANIGYYYKKVAKPNVYFYCMLEKMTDNNNSRTGSLRYYIPEEDGSFEPDYEDCEKSRKNEGEDFAMSVN